MSGSRSPSPECGAGARAPLPRARSRARAGSPCSTSADAEPHDAARADGLARLAVARPGAGRCDVGGARAAARGARRHAVARAAHGSGVAPLAALARLHDPPVRGARDRRARAAVRVPRVALREPGLDGPRALSRHGVVHLRGEPGDGVDRGLDGRARRAAARAGRRGGARHPRGERPRPHRSGASDADLQPGPRDRRRALRADLRVDVPSARGPRTSPARAPRVLVGRRDRAARRAALVARRLRAGVDRRAAPRRRAAGQWLSSDGLRQGGRRGHVRAARRTRSREPRGRPAEAHRRWKGSSARPRPARERRTPPRGSARRRRRPLARGIRRRGGDRAGRRTRRRPLRTRARGRSRCRRPSRASPRRPARPPPPPARASAGG